MAFKSGFERTLDTQLKKAKAAYKYESLTLDYSIHHKYRPDFVFDNGMIIEAKGRFMPGDAAKMRAVKAAHPHLDIRFVFMSAHQKIGRQKQTYAEWADRYGFPWADGEIPESWLT